MVSDDVNPNWPALTPKTPGNEAVDPNWPPPTPKAKTHTRVGILVRYSVPDVCLTVDAAAAKKVAR